MKVLLKRIWGLLGAGCWLVVLGCASVPEEPVLEAGLANLRFTRATVFETTAVLDIRLENLSPEELRVTGGSHRVMVNGIKLGTGLTGETLPVPRLGSAVQSVEFHLRNVSLARSIHDLSRSRLVDYELDSTLYLAGPGGSDRRVRVRKTGQLDLRAAEGARPPAGTP